MIEIPRYNFNKSDWVEGKILSGKKLAELVREDIAKKVSESGIKPGLAVLIAGEDEASKIYVGSKEKAALGCGFHSVVERKSADLTMDEALAIITKWNSDPAIDGILVQLPLPAGLDERKLLQAIDPSKDVDGFHYENIGRLYAKSAGTIPCTPLGIMVMIQELGFETAGKNAVVLGRSNIVGKPMAQLLMDAGQSTVTICHSKTSDIAGFVKNADIVVSAMGVRGVVKNEDFKPGALIIDVGMHRTETGGVTGDLDYKELIDLSSYITPVPKGVGPMTIAMLLQNTLTNAVRNKG